MHPPNESVYSLSPPVHSPPGQRAGGTGMRARSKVAALLLGAALAFSAVQAGSAATLRWAASRDIASLDPDSFGDTFTLSFLNHVYEGLVRYDENLKIEPA